MENHLVFMAFHGDKWVIATMFDGLGSVVIQANFSLTEVGIYVYGVPPLPSFFGV